MNDARLYEMEQRVGLLEEELRRLRARRFSPFRFGLLGLVLIGGLSIAAIGFVALTPTTAEAQKTGDGGLTVLEAPLVIRDKSGKTIVSVDADPVPSLQLLGPKGSVKLVITDTGGGVSVRNAPNGNPCALCFDSNGDGLLYLVSKNGKHIAELSKQGAVAFNDSEKMVARLWASPKGTGTLSIGDSDGDTMVEAGILEKRGIVRAYPYHPRVGEILKGSNFIVGAKQ